MFRLFLTEFTKKPSSKQKQKLLSVTREMAR
jgi:hypothetical protein